MSPRLPRVTGWELVRALERAGFAIARQKGSHVHLKREGTRVTVPVHAGDVVPVGTLHGILVDAGLTAEELISLL